MLKTANKTLMIQFKEAIGNLSYTSESASPLQPFMFKMTEQREFGIEQLLRTIKLLQPQSWEQFLGQASTLAGATPKMAQSYQNWQQVLHNHLIDVQIYKVGQRHPYDEGWEDRGTVMFPVLLGQTPAGDWVGLCPKFRTDATASDDRIRPTAHRQPTKGSLPINIHTLKLISQLKAAIPEGALMLQAYNSCEWRSGCFWKAAATKDTLLTDLLESTGFLKIFPFQGFSNCLTDGYRPEQLTQAEKAFYGQFSALDRCLQDNLTNLQEYIIGGYTNFYLYVIGETVAGDRAGVSTQAVWT
jgi:Nuclease A inhibitor-like protein